MLKVKINRNEFRSDLIPINVLDFNSEELFIEYESDGDVMQYDANKEKNVLTCYHDNSLRINKGDNIVCSYTMENSDGVEESIVRKLEIASVDDQAHSFTCVIDRFIDLDAETFTYGKTIKYNEDGDTYTDGCYIYLYLNSFHFCDNTDYGDTITVYSVDEDGEDITAMGELYSDRCIRFPLTEIEVPDTDIFDIIEGASEYNNGVQKNRGMAMMLFRYYGLISPEDTDWDEIEQKLFNENTLSVEYPSAPFVFRQYNFMFANALDSDKRNISLISPNVRVSIPLFSKFSTDTNQETNVSEKFVEVEKKKAINPYVEMEKDVYSPVFNDGNRLKRVTEIDFNLHFRQREGDDWKVVRNGYWNGVKEDHTFMDNSNSSQYGYFSYVDDKSSQSDLLKYLNFSDSDVKYRKNTLKKSFLRLSFFDSIQPTKQNLLCYSTVFVDTGLLFSKYMRNFEMPKVPSQNFGYSRILSDGVETKLNLSGSRVNREPYWSSYPNDNGEIEKYRLSSQFVVKDKYSSTSCSEGFYLYLWKDSSDGNVPTDIYMMVEFNHAGFGRTIPFMMPYDKSNNRIKTFEDIVLDFKNGHGYGVKEYLRYSYVHFKYLTTEENEHVYYLDYDSTTVNFKDGVLTLNLYEAKLIDLEDESN